jgi:hypothetical protein
MNILLILRNNLHKMLLYAQNLAELDERCLFGQEHDDHNLHNYSYIEHPSFAEQRFLKAPLLQWSGTNRLGGLDEPRAAVLVGDHGKTKCGSLKNGTGKAR